MWMYLSEPFDVYFFNILFAFFRFLIFFFNFLGVQCESICERGRFGADCQSVCDCEHGSSCEPQSGKCQQKNQTNFFENVGENMDFIWFYSCSNMQVIMYITNKICAALKSNFLYL